MIREATIWRVMLCSVSVMLCAAYGYAQHLVQETDDVVRISHPPRVLVAPRVVTPLEEPHPLAPIHRMPDEAPSRRAVRVEALTLDMVPDMTVSPSVVQNETIHAAE